MLLCVPVINISPESAANMIGCFTFQIWVPRSTKQPWCTLQARWSRCSLSLSLPQLWSERKHLKYTLAILLIRKWLLFSPQSVVDMIGYLSPRSTKQPWCIGGQGTPCHRHFHSYDLKAFEIYGTLLVLLIRKLMFNNIVQRMTSCCETNHPENPDTKSSAFFQFSYGSGCYYVT